MDNSAYTSSYVMANGIRLHYLEWGGSSLPDRSLPVLLFIPGLGCTAYIFDPFARRFTDHFRVLAFTRRGHGDSAAPDTGYDADTLTEDLLQFLDALRIEQVILVGHSLGYVELSRFAILHPERVSKLVFLDAAYDYTSPENQPVFEQNPLPQLTPAWPESGFNSIEEYFATERRLNPAADTIWSPAMEEEIRHRVGVNAEGKIEERIRGSVVNALNETMATYHAEYARIHAPMLCFFALQDGSDYLSDEYMTADQQAQVLSFFKNVGQPFQRRYAAQFRRDVPHARVVEIPNGHHYCFIKQEALVFEEMLTFLLDGS